MWATPAPAQDSPPANDPVDLEEVIVDGRPLESQARQFVEGVVDTPRGRGLARWAAPVCIGVVNLRREAAQQLADALVALADEFGVPVRDDACDPDIYIIGAVDAQGVAQEWVSRRWYEFRPRLEGINSTEIRPSMSSLELFTGSQAPVRWYGLSRPTLRRPTEASPLMTSAGRVDDLWRIFVIIDVDAIQAYPLDSVAQYLAMVSFSQIHMSADTSGLPSVLNMFGRGETGMTDWDRAYLTALYRSDPDQRLNRGDQASGIAAELRANPAQ